MLFVKKKLLIFHFTILCLILSFSCMESTKLLVHEKYVDIPFFPLFVKVCPMGTNQGYTILSYTLTQAYTTCLSTSTYMCYTLTRVQNLIRVHNTKMAFLHFFFEVSHY